MSFQDWQDNFQKLEICNLGPDSLDDEEAAQGKKRWEATAEVGEWIPRVNAGGCRNYLGMIGHIGKWGKAYKNFYNCMNLYSYWLFDMLEEAETTLVQVL